jgi:hypothetical protein
MFLPFLRNAVGGLFVLTVDRNCESNHSRIARILSGVNTAGRMPGLHPSDCDRDPMIRLIPIAAAALLGGARFAGPDPAQPAPATAHTQQDFRWSGRIGLGELVEVKNIIGDVRAEPTSGDEVVVTAERSGPNPGRVRVETVRRGGGVVFCAVYAGSSDDDGGRGWRSRDDGDDDEPRDACNARHNSVRGEDAPRVDFVVHLPAGVRLSARSVSGDVSARGLHSPVRAASVSGDVQVSSDGPVEANSVSGNVEATLGRTGNESLSFASVSGDVTLHLPANVDADFSARTLSGEIDSDFPLSIGGRGGRNGRYDDDDDDDDDDRRGPGRVRVRIGQQVRGQLGRGGPDIRVNTVSGDITLRRIGR